MAVAWTDITNAQVAAGAAVTTALMTALRDNPEGIAQRASGAPKIFGVPYDYQEFTSGGTWTKPSNAETGDKVIVHVVGGGGAGARGDTSGAETPQGGQGGGGAWNIFEDIDDLPATATVVVGAGGIAAGGGGGDGGNSSFGTAGAATSGVAPVYLEAEGGAGGSDSSTAINRGSGFVRYGRNNGFGGVPDNDYTHTGGGGGGSSLPGQSSVFGGGGGGGWTTNSNGTNAGFSGYAGRGGQGTADSGLIGDFEIDGQFPGGGGGAVSQGVNGDTVGGAGANGVVRVWCYREDV